jgi:leader peptidase (prepilin peptidase) / N-methyltransferase
VRQLATSPTTTADPPVPDAAVATLIGLAIAGFLLGPSLHHVGVRAAVRADFDGPLARCERCGAVRAVPWSPRCRHCSAPIRRREPLIWLLSAATFAASGHVAGGGLLLPAHLLLAALTTVLVVTDLDAKLIPNRLLYPGTVMAALLLAVGALSTGRSGDLGRGVAAGVGFFGLLLLVALVTRGGFGMGDVKLAVVLGLFMGFQGWSVLAAGLFYTGLYGGIPALVMIATRRAGRGDELPYGPAMVFGAWTALVAGGGGPFS